LGAGMLQTAPGQMPHLASGFVVQLKPSQTFFFSCRGSEQKPPKHSKPVQQSLSSRHLTPMHRSFVGDLLLLVTLHRHSR
jgi:hypothetical protein